MSDDKTKGDKNVISGVIGMAFIVALVFAVAYVFGSDRAGEVSLISGVIGGVAAFVYTAIVSLEHIDRRK